MIVRSYSLIIEITEDCPDWNAAVAQAAIDLGCMIEKNQILPHKLHVDDEQALYTQEGVFNATFVRTE